MKNQPNQLISLIIGIICSLIILIVICSVSGCAARPDRKPKSYIEMRMASPEYGMTLREGVKMFFEEPRVVDQVKISIMVNQWRREDQAKGVIENARAEVQNPGK